jgi:hypothetical protein
MITGTGIPRTHSPKFAGREKFSLRYGWPKKAVDATAVVSAPLGSITPVAGPTVGCDFQTRCIPNGIRWTL